MSASVMAARRRRGQYSHIWESQRMRRPRAASLLSSRTSRLKVADWPLSSSSASRSCDSSAACSSSHIRLRSVPSLSTASPKFGGNAEAISRRMRADILQPLPDAVTPIWRGPSECVERSVKEQRLGASATLTGIRNRRQRLEICVPGFVRHNRWQWYKLDVLCPCFPPAVTKTASTTPSTSARPRVVKSDSLKLRLIHLTSPSSMRLTKP